MDDRSRLLLKTLIEQYIGDGQPVGSRTLSKTSGLELSAATIRNVMADLEEMGLIASPHTSAGRIPTARGYRLFVDTMLTAEPTPLDSLHLQQLQHLQITADQPQKVIGHAAQLLSNLSNFVGVVLAPKRSTVFRHIEFLRLSERRIVVIIVSPDGDVQNRVIHTAQDYTQSQLIEASNFLCSHYAGRTIEEVRARLQTEVEGLRTEITALMQAAVAQDDTLEDDTPEQVVVSGERKLLAIDDFSHDLNHLRRAFDLFEQKAQLLKLLDTSAHAEGVRIYIGGESQVVPVEELSVVSAPYRVNGMVVGRLGVIGPTRMQYDKMIQIVDVTAKMVENALTLK